MELEGWTRVLVTLFATMNVVPVLPMVVHLIDDFELHERRVLTRRALAAGVGLALLITMVGQLLFDALGITIDDLRVAGGLILLIFAIHDMLFSTAQRKADAGRVGHDDVGIVPLGVPILVGPAGLTVLLVMADTQGILPTLLALLVVGVFNLLVLEFAPRVLGLLGRQATRAIGKVMSLFLAAIAVAMIRAGL